MRVNQRLSGLGTVGAFPSASLLFVEGRARALQRRDETDHGLAAVRHLPVVQDGVTDALGDLLGAAPSGVAQLRRADLTGELEFDRGEDGSQLLELVHELHSPLHKLHSISQKGGRRLETVYWRTPRKSVAVLRAYDKGIESGTRPVGERIRIERQLRYRGGRRPTLNQWLTADLAGLYTSPVRSWLHGGVAAGTAAELMRLLTDAAVIWPTYWASGACWATGTNSDRGRARQGRGWQGLYVTLWSPSRVERILGTLAVLDAYGNSWPAWNAKQRERRAREIRDMGLIVTDRPVRVDVDQAVSSLCELWRNAA